MVTAALVVAAGAAFALLRFYGATAPLRTFETLVGAIAFGAVIGAPGCWPCWRSTTDRRCCSRPPSSSCP